MHQKKRIAAFFDLDKTLLRVNTGRLWMLREHREGRIGWRQVLKASGFLLAYRFGTVDMEEALGEALKLVAGHTEDEVRRWTHEWYAADVAHHAVPGAFACVEAHRRAGHLLVLLTSSSPYASEAAVEQFGLDRALSSRFELEGEVFTGRLEPPLCYGEGKPIHARRLAEEEAIDLDGSYFYTDSHTDLPMLLEVGNPRIVQPDPRLRRLALKRGWPILDWGRPVAHI